MRLPISILAALALTSHALPHKRTRTKHALGGAEPKLADLARFLGTTGRVGEPVAEPFPEESVDEPAEEEEEEDTPVTLPEEEEEEEDTPVTLPEEPEDSTEDEDEEVDTPPGESMDEPAEEEEEEVDTPPGESVDEPAEEEEEEEEEDTPVQLPEEEEEEEEEDEEEEEEVGEGPGEEVDTPPVDGESSSNDACEAAQTLAPGDSTSGTTVLAASEEAPFCGDFLGGNVTGVWYMVEGTGDGLEAEIDADFDMQMAIFHGSCEELICVDGTAGEEFPWTSGDVKWRSEEGEMYYILVSGWQGAEGTFELEILAGEAPSNTDCADAERIELGQSVEGTTEFGDIPAEGEFPACTIDEIFTGITSPTVWYTFEGTGSIVQFSVFADYDAQISIYEGESCDALSCINSNDDSPVAGPQSVIAQPLEEGKLYYINIHGFDKRYGTFTIESEELEPAENDNCEDAIQLELGKVVNSDTLAATGDPNLPVCGFGSNATSPGVWYSVTGTGNTMQIRLNDTLSLHFSVYTGGCEDLVCAGNQFFGFYPLTWDTVEGEEYSVYVYGREFALTDTFGIIAEEVERPANDECSAAIPLEVNEIIEGTTRASSTEEGLTYCGDIQGVGETVGDAVDSAGDALGDMVGDAIGEEAADMIGNATDALGGLVDDVADAVGTAVGNILGETFGGVWYSFEGTGETMLVGVSSGADGEGFFDTILSVYQGSCDELVCLGGNDQGMTYQEFENAILLDTEEGETYYAFVQGFGLSRGDFEIGLLAVPRPENDDCASAEMLEMGDSVEASTEFAIMEDDFAFESCGTSQGGNFSAPGIWYGVEGDGFAVQASIFGQYDVQLTVFEGSCEELVCVDGTEGNENDFFNGRVIWTAEEGTTYYILVHGFSGATGEFELFYETAIF